MAVTGIDVSHHQGPVTWSQVAKAGHSFAWCKATEGLWMVDPRFAAHWKAIRAAGLTRGAYHFLRREADGAAQARAFLEVTGPLDGSLAAVDVETSAAGTNPRPDQLTAFADEFARRTGGHPLVVYTSRWWWHDLAGNPAGSTIGPLWHARYASDPGPLYGGWRSWAFWQHSERGSCPGVTGPVDLDRFAGTPAGLVTLTTPQETDDMFTDADRAALSDLQAAVANLTEPGRPRSLRERLDDIERAEITRDQATQDRLAAIERHLHL